MITADVIIVAAGSGSRFGMPKQLVPLHGKQLYRHSVDVFASHPQVGRIVLVVSADVEQAIASDLSNAYPSDRIELTLGGATRQGSVSNGLKKLGSGRQSEIVLVHDAARPGIETQLITSIIEATETFGAALAAIPVVDTLKREADGFAGATVSRAHLWRAQTPQGAKRDLLAKAIEQAESIGFDATDEAELLERIGIRAKLVGGSERNIKVTYPEDMERVARIMVTLSS